MGAAALAAAVGVRGTTGFGGAGRSGGTSAWIGAGSGSGFGLRPNGHDWVVNWTTLPDWVTQSNASAEDVTNRYAAMPSSSRSAWFFI